jgi:hypothetical protein
MKLYVIVDHYDTEQVLGICFNKEIAIEQCQINRADGYNCHLVEIKTDKNSYYLVEDLGIEGEVIFYEGEPVGNDGWV